MYLLNQYIEIASKAIATFNGRIDKIIVDSVMALFVNQNDRKNGRTKSITTSAKYMALLSKECEEDFGFESDLALAYMQVCQ